MNMCKYKTSTKEDILKQPYCDYIPCLYEDFFPVFLKKSWRKMIIVAVIFYFGIIGLFQLGINVFKVYVNNSISYTYAAFILATIIFWPIIVIYNSKTFWETGKKIGCLLNSTEEKFLWYEKAAKSYFRFYIKKSRKSFLLIFVSSLCSIGIIAIYVLKVYFSYLIPQFIDNPFLLVACVILCLFILCIQKDNTNVHVVLFTMCCGFSYYVYITEYSTIRLEALFSPDFIFGTVIIFLLIAVVFFIAGTTIMPMLGLFKVFFMSDFEKKIKYPINEIACGLEKIQSIKKYFMHLTGINLLAYFQLFGVVYFLRLLDTGSMITKILFLLGSFFPVIMYLAASVFFKKLCYKIYILHVKEIDTRIVNELKKSSLDAEQIQALVAVKEMYANEFEIHSSMSKEVLIAMLTPIITSLSAIIFPFGNFGG